MGTGLSMQELSVLADLLALSILAVLMYEICRSSRESCRVAVVGFAVIVYAVLNKYMGRGVTVWEILVIFLIVLYALLR
jgi:steroid 5-alpha reductase family enzyme